MHQQGSICKLLVRLSRQAATPAHRVLYSTHPLPFPKPTINTRLHWNSPAQFLNLRRDLCSGGSGEFDENKEVDMINLKFAEAREEIEMAMESKETVYFDEEAECARSAVKDVLDMYEALLANSPETKRAALQRAMGLKIEQLKAELHQLNE